MRSIAKGKEPNSLSTHRVSTHSDYCNYSDKDVLREALVRDQQGLCCYCMSRIEAVGEAMKIEHWQCQENYSFRQLDYSNMLGACRGGEGQPETKQHCDTRKGQRDLKFNPADPGHRIDQRISYHRDGTITSSDDEFRVQLEDVLNLNLDLLRNRRKGVIDALADWLREYHRRHHRRPDNSILQRKRAQWVPSSGSLQAYAGVAVWWLDQRLARSET